MDDNSYCVASGTNYPTISLELPDIKMLGWVTEPVCWALATAYAPYMSFKAIHSAAAEDDKDW